MLTKTKELIPNIDLSERQEMIFLKDIDQTICDLFECRNKIYFLKKEEDMLREKIKLAMDGHPKAQSLNYYISWGRVQKTFNRSLFEQEYPNLVEKYTEEKLFNTLNIREIREDVRKLSRYFEKGDANIQC